jgi:hypothetical protein
MSRRASVNTHIYRYSFLLASIWFLNGNQIFAADILAGNSQNPDQTFLFSVDKHILDESTGRVYVAAAPQAGNVGNVNDFAVSVFGLNKPAFEPLTPEKIDFNGYPQLKNPLFDAGIEHVGLVTGQVIQNQNHPIAVPSNYPYALYFYESLVPPKLVGILMLDAHGALTRGIVGLSRHTRDFIFAAVKPHNGVFGDVGSGIAIAVLGTTTIQKEQGSLDNKKDATDDKIPDQKEEVIKKSDDAKTDDEKKKDDATQKKIVEEKTILNMLLIDSGTGLEHPGARAFSFDITTEQLKIGNNLTSMAEIVDIHWDGSLGRVYMALQITTGSQSTDGGRALVVGRIQRIPFETTLGEVREKRLLILEKIAPDEAFNTTANNMIGVVGAHAHVSLHKVRTMATSTGLHYVVVVGGIGDSSTTKRSVYAMSLVSNSLHLHYNGMLASKHATPIDVFQAGKAGVPDTFVRRDIRQPVTSSDDMFVATDPSVLVGAGELRAGDITDIFIQGDAIFVTVGSPADPNQEPGIFYSQAIFDETSKVKAWTAWRPVAGTIDQVFGGVFNMVNGNFLFMTNDESNAVNIVKQTTWNNTAQDGLTDLKTVAVEEFPLSEGGIQGFIDLPAHVPGLNDISLMIMTGRNKIVLIESGFVIGNVLHPLYGSFASNKICFDKGTIQTTLPLGNNKPKIVSIKGGVLDNIGSLVTAEIACDSSNNNGWLFVGGINGLAVLSDANGNGWNPIIGLGADFIGLDAGMSFKVIPGYSFVRKIIRDDKFLYVLTDTRLDRIDLAQDGIGLGHISAVTLATHAQIAGSSGFFSDCIVSEKFALLATSRGLLRVGNDRDIRTASTQEEVGWTLVTMPEGVKGIRQLLAVSKSGLSQDVARNSGGQLYALQVDRGTNRSDITRFSVNPVENDVINDATIKPFADMYVKDVISYRMNFGMLKTVFSTDGALYLSGHGIDLFMNPMVTFPRDFILKPFIGVNLHQIPVPVSYEGGSHITGITRSFSLGSWLISGDFGLRINE